MQDGDNSNPISEVAHFLNEFRSTVFSLINRKDFNKSATELLPPWIMTIYPLDVPGVHNLEATSPLYGEVYWYWRGGVGGTYWAQFQAQFWNTLSLDEKRDYFLRYDLGPEWPEREEWVDQMFDAENELAWIRSEFGLAPPG